MATYKSHQLFALILAGLFLFLNYKYGTFFSFSMKQVIIATLILLLYSILPDIDIPTGKLRKMFTPVILVIVIIAIILGLYFVAIISVSLLLFLSLLRHRGITHTLTASLVLTIPLLYYNFFYFIFALIGYLSHLLLDRKIKLI